MPQHLKTLFNKLVLSSGAASLLLGVMGTATLITVTHPTPAAAQFFSPFGYEPPRYRSRYYNKRRARQRPARRSKSVRQQSAQSHREPEGPLLLLVSIGKQRIYVHDSKGLVAEGPISSGQRGYRTPTGIFTILQKNRRHYSNLYGGAPMPNMQRITWSGVALHGGVLPGYPASHGCIRLPHAFARNLFGITSMNARVIISHDRLEPSSFTHANLFKPLPPLDKILPSHVLNDMESGVNVAGLESKSRVNTVLADVIGVNAAAAAEGTAIAGSVPGPSRVSRLRYERAVRKAGIAAELIDSQKAFDDATARLKLTADNLDVAKADLKQARVAVAEKKKEAKTTHDAASAAHERLGAFDEKYRHTSKNLRADELYRLAELERELDERAVYWTNEAASAQTAVYAAERRIAGFESAVEVAGYFKSDAEHKLARAESRLDTAKKADTEFQKAEEQRTKPVSVFISRKAGRMYVRQDWKPLFDVSIDFEEPDKVVGTHVFTALETVDGGKDLKWNAVSVDTPRDRAEALRRSRDRKKSEDAPEIFNALQTPGAALDRITIPNEAREQIEDLIKPGSSLIVSDYPVSNETGKYTDFIVLTR